MTTVRPPVDAFDSVDATYMRRALALAARGLETTDPNPRVGCVLVREGEVVGEGWHERAGDAHAEARALDAAGARAAGATAYVTLEPCSHFGRTPPCADALIRGGVQRVIYAMEDPNPAVQGRGAARLRAAAVEVAAGLCSQEAEVLNEGFNKRMRTGRPFVRVKIAMSLDGRTALANGSSQWITGEAARADVQRWRARSSAVLTGIGTILADDPRLTVHDQTTTIRQPARVILDTNWQTPSDARVFKDPAPVVIFGTSSKVAEARVASSDTRHLIAKDPHDLAAVMDALGQMSCNEILVEAGPTLSGALLNSSLADELIVYLAPVLLGPQARPMAELPLLERLDGAIQFSVRESAMFGQDVRLILRPRSDKGAW